MSFVSANSCIDHICVSKKGRWNVSTGNDAGEEALVLFCMIYKRIYLIDLLKFIL